MNKVLKILGFVLVLVGVVLVLRFVLGGNEDTWVCQDGQWVKHGNPSEPQPAITCEKNGQTVEDLLPTGEFKKVTFEESQQIATDFVSTTSTYKYDGSGLNLKSSVALKCPYCWEFKFSFDCAQAGFGDRKDKISAQVITPHELIITVDQGVVVAAVIDGTYDEINGKYIK